jgi:hypothetical protein
MRCTKCGFISFDFNRVCPKCNRELMDEQRKLNLPSFRPDPPQLLRNLVGRTPDEEVGIRQEPDIALGEATADHEIDTGLDASFTDFEDDAYVYEREEDHDVVSLEPEEPGLSPSIPETGAGAVDLNLELEDILLKGPDAVSKTEAENDEVLLDLLINDDLFVGGQEKNIHIAEELSGKETGGPGSAEEDLSFNLDNLSFDDLDLEMSQVLESTNEPYDTSQPGDEALNEKRPLEEFLLDDNPEGLTREIDMKKFRKDLQKGERTEE